jgi:lipopolysaccharide transport system permease protein
VHYRSLHTARIVQITMRPLPCFAMAQAVMWEEAMDVSARAWVDNSFGTGRKPLDWREVWRYRELVTFLAWRDVKVRYKQTAFGVLWAVARPLAAMAVFTLVFGRLVHAPSDGVPYVLFALTGVIVWTLFADGLDAATTSLVANEALITKVYFPRIAVPLASVLPRVLDFGVSLLLLAVLLVVERHPPGPQVLLLPVVVVWCVVLAFGVGLTFATIQVRYRDAHHALGLLVQVWLFASPVAYSSSLVPSNWRWVYALNPLVGPLDTARWILLATPPPGVSVLASLATGLFAVWLGLHTFARNERSLADVI